MRVGGRVLQKGGSEIVLADPWAQVRLQTLGGSLPEVGVWVRASGLWDGSVFRASHLEVFPGREPNANSEQASLLWSGRGRGLRARAEALRVIRAYFREQRFVEVDTPTLVPCPGLDPHVHSLGSVDHDGRRDWLVTSPELHLKRLIVGGMPRVFEVAHCFRAEELGPWHEPEFTLVEWYRAFADFTAVLRDTEQLVARVARALRGSCELLRHTEGTPRVIDVTPPFERCTIREAFARFARVDDAVSLAQQDETRFFEILVNEVEPALAAEARPVFLTHYPRNQASLARPCPHDPSVAERFELYAGGVELCNGFSELTDPVEQRRRFEAERARRRAAGEPVYPLDEKFLRALEEGLPPTAGNALGLDRLVVLALGLEQVALVRAFPAGGS